MSKHNGRYNEHQVPLGDSCTESLICHKFSMNALPENYDTLLESLKTRIRQAQVKAALAVNRELVVLYWQIGKDILARQEQQGWGARVIDRLSADLRKSFPGMKGLSRTNLLYMRAFSEAYPDESIGQQLVGQIP